MKRIMTLALAAAMVFGAATGASAIDFKASGQWLFGVSAGEGNLVNKHNGRHDDTNDTFFAGQRLRTQIDAVASEALSGTVYFEITTRPGATAAAAPPWAPTAPWWK